MKPSRKTAGAWVRAAALASLALHAAVSPAQTVSSNKTGYHGGYFYSFWTDAPGTVSMTLGPGGKYTVDWTKTGNFTAGKGWAKGGPRVVQFAGRFDAGSNGYLAVYGWTKQPLVEYYIVENHGAWEPPGAEPIGMVESDGGTYKVYKTLRENQPSIVGTATFYQYWSVRTTKRSEGVVTTKNHFDAWAKLGLKLGKTFDYMILETEGYQSSGSAEMTVGSLKPQERKP